MEEKFRYDDNGNLTYHRDKYGNRTWIDIEHKLMCTINPSNGTKEFCKYSETDGKISVICGIDKKGNITGIPNEILKSSFLEIFFPIKIDKGE